SVSPEPSAKADLPSQLGYSSSPRSKKQADTRHRDRSFDQRGREEDNPTTTVNIATSKNTDRTSSAGKKDARLISGPAPSGESGQRCRTQTHRCSSTRTPRDLAMGSRWLLLAIGETGIKASVGHRKRGTDGDLLGEEEHALRQVRGKPRKWKNS
ncbi:MAG: hypothetical protein LQ347_004523, partial [Umbilicaria vellea]